MGWVFTHPTQERNAILQIPIFDLLHAEHEQGVGIGLLRDLEDFIAVVALLNCEALLDVKVA